MPQYLVRFSECSYNEDFNSSKHIFKSVFNFVSPPFFPLSLLPILTCLHLILVLLHLLSFLFFFPPNLSMFAAYHGFVSPPLFPRCLSSQPSLFAAHHSFVLSPFFPFVLLPNLPCLQLILVLFHLLLSSPSFLPTLPCLQPIIV